jgi:hypothetical protein
VRNSNIIELVRADKEFTGIINFLNPLEFYEGEVLTQHEKIQEKLSRLKFPPESTDTSSNGAPPPSNGGTTGAY